MTDYSHIPAPPAPPVPSLPLPPVAAPYIAETVTPGSGAPRSSNKRAWFVGAAVLSVLAMVGAVVALAGGASSDPKSPLAAAAARSTAQKTVKFEMTISAPGVTGDAMKATGAVDFEHAVTHLHLDLSGAASVAGSKFDPNDASIEVVSSGTVSYMKMPMLGQLMNAGDKWIKIDASKLADGSQMGGLALPEQNTDPAQMLDLLKANADSLETVGVEKVRGVDATHHHAVLDVARLAKEGGADQAKIDELLKQIGDSKVEVDVWIDADSLVRRMAMTIPSPEGNVTVDMMYFDYGSKVDAAIPAESDVVDMTSLLGGK